MNRTLKQPDVAQIYPTADDGWTTANLNIQDLRNRVAVVRKIEPRNAELQAALSGMEVAINAHETCLTLLETATAELVYPPAVREPISARAVSATVEQDAKVHGARGGVASEQVPKTEATALLTAVEAAIAAICAASGDTTSGPFLLVPTPMSTPALAEILRRVRTRRAYNKRPKEPLEPVEPVEPVELVVIPLGPRAAFNGVLT